MPDKVCCYFNTKGYEIKILFCFIAQQPTSTIFLGQQKRDQDHEKNIFGLEIKSLITTVSGKNTMSKNQWSVCL